MFLERHPEVTRLVGELPKEKIIAVLLFGSSATVKTHPLSDIDICIITGHDLSGEEREAFHSFASRRIHLSLFSDLPPAVQLGMYCAAPTSSPSTGPGQGQSGHI